MQEKARQVAAACMTFEEWAEAAYRDQTERGEALCRFHPGPSKVVLHGHCHQKALVGLEPTRRLLSLIPGCESRGPGDELLRHGGLVWL